VPDKIKIFDRAAVRRNRNRAAARFAAHDFLFQWTVRQLHDRLGDVRRDFPLALQIGARGDCAAPQIGRLIRLDLGENLLGPGGIQGDEEALPFAAGSFDLVLSPLSLHTVNDLPGALVQIRRALRPDGLFMGAMLGGETLHELRQCLMQAEMSVRNGASPRVAPFADKQQMGSLMQRGGFALPVVDSEIVTVTYENPFRLMRDLRFMGEGNAVAERSRAPLPRAMLQEAARLYAQNFAEPGGRIAATFEIIFLIGWAPHESQQKPLRPGSAEKSLAEALGATETSAGEKAQP
jgi:SAM-dependent methyltransferase